jgi:hypothetical protein
LDIQNPKIPRRNPPLVISFYTTSYGFFHPFDAAQRRRLRRVPSEALKGGLPLAVHATMKFTLGLVEY